MFKGQLVHVNLDAAFLISPQISNPDAHHVAVKYLMEYTLGDPREEAFTEITYRLTGG